MSFGSPSCWFDGSRVGVGVSSEVGFSRVEKWESRH